MTILYNNKILCGAGRDGIGLPIGYIGMSAIGIREEKNFQRYLNGQRIYQSQFKQFTRDLKRHAALYPSSICTNEEYETILTMSKFGQCGKFVIDDEAGTIRLPKVVKVQGCLNLTNISKIVDESLPNISGEVSVWNDSGIGNGINTGVFKYNERTFSKGTYAVDVTTKGLSFDASLSSSTYQDNAPVQEEAIQYPYFIQVAIGIEETIDVERELELNNPFSLFDTKWADHELQNASWLCADYFSWHSGTIYISAYNELLSEYNLGTEKTEEGITYKETPKGYKIAAKNQESLILNKYNTDGIAWYYILDTANSQFKLPRAKHPSLISLSNTAPVYGNGKTLGLTNGTQNVGLYGASNGVAVNTGSTYGANIGVTRDGSGTLATALITLGVTTDSSKSGIIADLSNAAKSQELPLKLYFYVGEILQDTHLINTSEVLNELNNKIDVNHSNDNIPYLKTCYVNGTSGYNIWSNGYCEQWGECTASTTGAITVALAKTFKDTNYNLSMCVIGTTTYENTAANLYDLTAFNKGVSSFQTHVNSSTNRKTRLWKASGYLASGQY